VRITEFAQLFWVGVYGVSRLACTTPPEATVRFRPYYTTGGRLVDEALFMQDAKDFSPLGLAECPWLWCACSRPRRRWTLAVASIVRCSRAAQRRTCCSFAKDGRQFGDGLIKHHFGSPPLGSALPVASCSSNAESFRCTSITRRALPRSACNRATS
jgi:hypothetical protein